LHEKCPSRFDTATKKGVRGSCEKQFSKRVREWRVIKVGVGEDTIYIFLEW
jgi:hypothetical protein